MKSWEYCFNEKTLKYGKSLQKNGSVTSLKYDPKRSRVIAVVAGTYAVQYTLTIELDQSAGYLQVESFCNCPISRECKHAAAAMYAFEKRCSSVTGAGRKSKKVIPADPYSEWLNSMIVSPEASKAEQAPKEKSKPQEFLVYILRHDKYEKFPISVTFGVGRLLKKGGWSKVKPAVRDFYHLLSKEYVTPEDHRLLVDLHLLYPKESMVTVPLNSEAATDWLLEMVETGRCCWQEGGEANTLSNGPERAGELSWEILSNGDQKPVIATDHAMVLPVEKPCYLDEKQMLVGALKCEEPLAVVQRWINGPVVSPDAVQLLQIKMSELLGDQIKVQEPKTIHSREERSLTEARMVFMSVPAKNFKCNYFGRGEEGIIHVIKVEYVYGDQVIDASSSDKTSMVWDGEERVTITRDFMAEAHMEVSLDDVGFSTVSSVYYWVDSSDPARKWLTLEDEDEFAWVIGECVPELEAHGWKMVYDSSFELKAYEPDAWYVDLHENASGTKWFDAEVGVTVGGESINLLPHLLNFLKETPARALSRVLEDDVILQVAENQRVLIPAERMRMLVSMLLELFDKEPLSKNKTLQVSWLRAVELVRMQQSGYEWGGQVAKEIAQKVEHFSMLPDVPQVEVPATLNADLRTYQKQGLSWLQFLREAGFGAVLADDMGLGKTIQMLAHILEEKRAGRLTNPCLIVTPTSVLYNWECETARFAPELRVHVSHGPERSEFFETFAEYDLIITSYPLIVRDGKMLLKKEFHLLVLDEAQFVRNHKTQASRTVRLIKASQRVALTGTPLENNLDELWALFSFVVPGLLGEHALFRKLFATPIEKSGNEQVRRMLAQRIAPFMLRRTKDEVLHELPPKTEIIQHIELDDAQKDLYELVRASVEKKVRQAIEEKGLGRSHIMVLDALLKMRQVCCHPALLKLKAAEKVKTSAKLDALCDLVAELVSEGRRILIFSQFTTMLQLIEDELNKEKIGYVKITGSTRDRKTPVDEFQNGTIPVFLISLKAGGTGLNLTAADTVIHYDPWWNPAVENQATDRAHRMGQEKPVFVYKLIAAGTVEEKIVELQNKKQELINSLLDEQKDVLGKWSESDLDDLFKPLGDG